MSHSIASDTFLLSTQHGQSTGYRSLRRGRYGHRPLRTIGSFSPKVGPCVGRDALIAPRIPIVPSLLDPLAAAPWLPLWGSCRQSRLIGYPRPQAHITMSQGGRPYRRSRTRPPLCKGRWRGAPEGLRGTGLRIRRRSGKFERFLCAIPQSASLTAPFPQGSLSTANRPSSSSERGAVSEAD